MNKPVFAVATKALIVKDDKLLILYKTKEEIASFRDDLKYLGTCYEPRRDFPGGRLEFGEEPKDALVREVKEETRLTVEIGKIVDTWQFIKNNFQLVGINYLCKWQSGEVVLSDEHEHFEWLSKKELLAKNWDDVERYLIAFE